MQHIILDFECDKNVFAFKGNVNHFNTKKSYFVDKKEKDFCKNHETCWVDK